MLISTVLLILWIVPKNVYFWCQCKTVIITDESSCVPYPGANHHHSKPEGVFPVCENVSKSELGSSPSTLNLLSHWQKCKISSFLLANDTIVGKLHNYTLQTKFSQVHGRHSLSSITSRLLDHQLCVLMQPKSQFNYSNWHAAVCFQTTKRTLE